MMIFCLVGTNPYSFTRLVSYVDETLGPKYNVTIQLGNTSYSPKYSNFFKFRKRSDILNLINKSDIVITQGGFGSMNDALSCNKNLIAVPRLIELNESQDDQKELVEYYNSKNFLVACYDVSEIDLIINQFKNNQIFLKKYEPESKLKVKDLIESFLNDNQL